MKFDAEVFVAVGDREVDAKSLLSVLALGARPGTTLRLRADGDDADGAVATLADLVSGLTE
jgi:phosphotransferase system HPr (HPr) family protein